MKIIVLDKCTVTKGDVSLLPLEAFGEVEYYDLLPKSEIKRLFFGDFGNYPEGVLSADGFFAVFQLDRSSAFEDRQNQFDMPPLSLSVVFAAQQRDSRFKHGGMSAQKLFGIIAVFFFCGIKKFLRALLQKLACLCRVA